MKKNRMNDLITPEQLFIDKPATINVDIDKNGKIDINIDGTFVDVIGVSFDIISGLCERGVERKLLRQSIVDRETFEKILIEHNHIPKDAYMHMKIDETRYINFECGGKPIDYIVMTVKMIDYLVDYYNITYSEYVEAAFQSDDAFVRNNRKDLMKYEERKP